MSTCWYLDALLNRCCWFCVLGCGFVYKSVCVCVYVCLLWVRTFFGKWWHFVWPSRLYLLILGLTWGARYDLSIGQTEGWAYWGQAQGQIENVFVCYYRLGQNNSSLKAVEYLIGKISSCLNIQDIHVEYELTHEPSHINNVVPKVIVARRLNSSSDCSKHWSHLYKTGLFFFSSLVGWRHWKWLSHKAQTQTSEFHTRTEKLSSNEFCTSLNSVFFPVCLPAAITLPSGKAVDNYTKCSRVSSFQCHITKLVEPLSLFGVLRDLIGRNKSPYICRATFEVLGLFHAVLFLSWFVFIQFW